MPAPRPPDSLLEAFRALPAAAPMLAPLSEIDGIHLVGGAVRDLLLGGRPQDLDFVVEGEVAPVIAGLGGAVQDHDRFGTSTVTLAGRSYDFARARREAYPRPGALPEVEPASLEEDLRRRDFTVNALALTVSGADAGRLTSVPLALEDLRDGLLRVLHDRSFEDDPTRILRLARYRARLGFALEPRTHRLLAAALSGGALETVSGSRLGTELRLAAAEDDPVAALSAVTELGAGRALAPGFGLSDPDLTRRALELLPADGDRSALALACFALGIDRPRLAALLDALAFPAAQRDTIRQAAGEAKRLAGALRSASTASEIDAAVGALGPETVALAGALGAAQEARQWLGRLRHVRLEIDGDDLLRAGLEPGPAIGAGLRAARAAKLDGLVHGREDELAAALRAASSGASSRGVP